MNKYIDAEKLKKRIKLSPAFPNMGTDGFFLRDLVMDLIDSMPADDVPMTEIDRARQMGFECGKRQAATEIYNAIHSEIIEASHHNFKAIKERETKHNVNRYEDPFCTYCNGKIHALDGVGYALNELIKKYPEEIK